MHALPCFDKINILSLSCSIWHELRQTRSTHLGFVYIDFYVFKNGLKNKNQSRFRKDNELTQELISMIKNNFYVFYCIVKHYLTTVGY